LKYVKSSVDKKRFEKLNLKIFQRVFRALDVLVFDFVLFCGTEAYVYKQIRLVISQC